MPSRSHHPLIQAKDPAMKYMAPLLPKCAKVDGVVAPERLYSTDGGTPVRHTVNESESRTKQWRQLLF